MVGQEAKTFADMWFRGEEVNNGCRVGIRHDFFNGNLSQGESLRTYKRRKRARLRSTKRSTKRMTFREWMSSVEAADQFNNQNFRDVVLEDVYQSLSDDEGGIKGCVGEVLRIESATTVKGTDCINTDGCQRAFSNIITSEKFTLLCKVLLENFQGIKVDRIFDFCAINSRMKRGAYENSPKLFEDDMQKVWKNLQDIGAEIITLAVNLSELSRTSCNEHVGGYACCTFEEGKNESQEYLKTSFPASKLSTLEPDSGVEVEQTAACDVHKVRTCRLCEEKADEKNGLVCDSCEEMYHVSCIDPAVKEIPPKSWCCAKCSAKGFGSSHENCVVCDRLNSNAPRFEINEAGDEICQLNTETSLDFEENSNCSTADVGKPSYNSIDDGKSEYFCKICRRGGGSNDKFRLCEHPYCFSKSYHERCLTPKELKRYGPHWYCPSCLCRACVTDTDDDKIVLCDGCDQAYHLYCMEPPRTSVPFEKWFCRKCDAGFQEIRRAKRAHVDKLRRQCEEESDEVRRGMDMLLNAARTLSFQEMAAN